MKRTLDRAPFDEERDRIRATGHMGKIDMCRWCGGGLSGRRRSWCSDECVAEYLVRADPAYARARVSERDHGVCALCGRDTARLQQFWYKGKHYLHRLWKKDHVMGRDLIKAWRRMRTASLGTDYRATGYWDMDHIVPVVKGGGGCGLDNLRTLCIPCHRGETADLARRRARDYDPQQQLGL
ncbi:MAG: HNH endonuclease signature motif containing protein [Dehalococcoidales bacterium]